MIAIFGMMFFVDQNIIVWYLLTSEVYRETRGGDESLLRKPLPKESCTRFPSFGFFSHAAAFYLAELLLRHVGSHFSVNFPSFGILEKSTFL